MNKETSSSLQQIYKILQTPLGSGSLSTTYKAINRTTKKPITLKRIQTSETDKNKPLFQSTVKSIHLLKHISHENIRPIIGFKSRKEEVWLETAYYENGNLRDWLYNPVGSPVSFTPVQIATLADAVLTILYFMDSNYPTIQFDIKSSRIYITSKGKVKIDIMKIKLRHATDRVLTKIEWIPPEIITHGQSSSKGNIFMFGIMLLELALGKIPALPEKTTTALQTIVSGNITQLYPINNWPPEFINFINLTLTKDPFQRPTAKKLKEDPFILQNRSADSLEILYRQLFPKQPTQETTQNPTPQENNNTLSTLPPNNLSHTLEYLSEVSLIYDTYLLQVNDMQKNISHTHVLIDQILDKNQQSLNSIEQLLQVPTLMDLNLKKGHSNS